MVVQYNIPNEVIEKFKERGKQLAFLAGQKEGNSVTVSHIIFPIQHEYQPDRNFGKYLLEFWINL